MSRKALLLCFLLCSESHGALAMSVDEAYRSIPHQKTDFDHNTARMRAGESAYLDSFFTLVNAAIVARVQTLQWFSSGGSAGIPYAHYRASIDAILADFERLTVPAGLGDVQQQVLAAVRLHSEYFADWTARTSRGERYRFSSKDKRISASSRLLISAYKRLMQRYPKATRNNRQAFYDHLCALDFI
jgi:hypothetical protein